MPIQFINLDHVYSSDFVPVHPLRALIEQLDLFDTCHQRSFAAITLVHHKCHRHELNSAPQLGDFAAERRSPLPAYSSPGKWDTQL